jgi:hypothetical protein
MFYTFPYTVTANDIVTAKHREEMTLTAGIIHQVDILFQKDAAHKINVQIFHGGHQIWPTNRGSSIKGDATVISFREFYELKGAVNDLHALFWTIDTGVLYEVIIQIGILPKRIIQPLSFDELVSSIAGLK